MNELATKEGLYIYCIIPCKSPERFGRIGIGDRGDLVYTLRYKDIAAVVSRSPLPEYRVRRDESMTHQRVIEAAMANYPVLPVRYSTVANSRTQIIQRVLAPRHEEFLALLAWVADKEELGVRARWTNMNQVFQSLANRDTVLSFLKAKVAKNGAQAAGIDPVQIGERVQALLKEFKESTQQTILEPLKKIACDHKVHTTYGDEPITNSAFLVEKAKREEFVKAMEGLESRLGQGVQLKLVSGAPPFNFVNLVIQLNEPAGSETNTTSKERKNVSIG